MKVSRSRERRASWHSLPVIASLAVLMGCSSDGRLKEAEMVTSVPAGAVRLADVASADSDGGFSIDVRLPADLEPGVFSVIGSSPSQSGWFSSATIVIRIQPTPALGAATSKVP